MTTVPDQLLRCPSCRRGALTDRSGTAVCERCGAVFTVSNGVVDLLPTAAHQPGSAQRAMEWPWLVGIYESRLWRRSPLIAAALGCTFAEEQSHVLRSLALKPGARVLDLACGPGIYTRPIARAAAGGVVLGLDISRPMLSYATARAREEGIDNIVWLHASALDIPVADGTLDGVTCCGALHMFSDLPGVLSEIRRVLEPGGRFALAMARRLDGPVGAIEMASAAWGGLTPRSSDELRSLLEAAGFDGVVIHHARRIWQIAGAVRPG